MLQMKWVQIYRDISDVYMGNYRKFHTFCCKLILQIFTVCYDAKVGNDSTKLKRELFLMNESIFLLRDFFEESNLYLKICSILSHKYELKSVEFNILLNFHKNSILIS